MTSHQAGQNAAWRDTSAAVSTLTGSKMMWKWSVSHGLFQGAQLFHRAQRVDEHRFQRKAGVDFGSLLHNTQDAVGQQRQGRRFSSSVKSRQALSLPTCFAPTAFW